MSAHSRFSDILASFGAPALNPEQLRTLPGGEAVAKTVNTMEHYFTSGVGFLARTFPNPRVNGLMQSVWDLVHYKYVQVALGPNVPSLTYAVVRVGETGQQAAVFFLPYTWAKMFEEDPYTELGSLIFTGSQAVDYYNDRIQSQEDSSVSNRRGRIYEAEFFLTLQQRGTQLTPFQQKILADYPTGLGSPSAGELIYPPKAVVPR